MSTDDIAGIYLNSIRSVNQLKHSQEVFEKAKAFATSNESLQEYAVTSNGHYIAQDKEGNLTEVKDLKEFADNGLSPITNQQLINMRAYSANMVGQKGDTILENVIGNGMGVNKIGEFIKSMASKIGTSETKLEGISQVEAGKVKAGLEILAGAPDGYYKITKENKTQQAQVNAALAYIENILSPAQRAILNTHGGTRPLIQSFLTSQQTEVNNIDIQPLTGKAASKEKGQNDEIKSNFLDQIQRDQIGVDREFSLITKDGNTKLYSLNSKYISQLPNVTSDMSLEQMLGVSKIGSIMDSRLGVTFGDQVINPENFKDIMFDLGGGATIVTLPCKYENGHKVVNFAIKDEFDSAVKEVSKNIPVDYTNPQFVKALSEKLHEKGLDSLLNGDNLDPNMFGHFMVVSAYTTDKVKFNTDSRYVEKVRNPDKALEERIIKGLSSNKDKNDYELDINDKWGIFELTYDDVYRGSVFIPLNNDPVSAQTGWGNDNIKLNETQNLAEQYQNYQKSSKQKDSSSNSL